MSVFLEALAWAGELLNLANLRSVSGMRREYMAGFEKFIDIKTFISGLGLFCSSWHLNNKHPQTPVLFMSNDVLFLLNSLLDYEQNLRFPQQLPPPIPFFYTYCNFMCITS